MCRGHVSTPDNSSLHSDACLFYIPSFLYPLWGVSRGIAGTRYHHISSMSPPVFERLRSLRNLPNLGEDDKWTRHAEDLETSRSCASRKSWEMESTFSGSVTQSRRSSWRRIFRKSHMSEMVRIGPPS